MTRIHSFLILMAFVLAMLVAGCGGGSGGGGSSAVVKGLVTHANGTPFGGVTIKSGAATTTSLANGSYTLSLPAGVNRKITASISGCADTFHVISLTAGQMVPLDFSLNTIGSSTSLHNLTTLPATVTDPRGAEIKLALNTVVDNTGAAVDNAVVSVTTGLPSDAKFTDSFPGLFVGSVSGLDTDIESFGFTTVAITSNGHACNLRNGTMANLAIPVAPGSDPGTQTIALWALDETTGKWIGAGTAQRDSTGSPVVYRAQVSHFSTYNLDRPISQPLPFTITVKEFGGSTVAGASVLITATNQTGGGKWAGRGITGVNGTVFFPNVPQGSVAAKALAGNQAGNAGSYDVANGAATMTITFSRQLLQSSLPFSITVKNSNGGTVAGASVVVTSDNRINGGSVTAASGVTDANGVSHFPNVGPGYVMVKVQSGNQVGLGRDFDVTNGAAAMTINLFTGVLRIVTVVSFTAPWNPGNETNIPNIDVFVSLEPGNHNVSLEPSAYDWGITDADGKATIILKDSLQTYTYGLIDPRNGFFNLLGTVPALGIPDKWDVDLTP